MPDKNIINDRWLDTINDEFTDQHKIKEFMEINSRYMEYPTPEQEKFARETFKHLLTDKNTDNVDIFPARCGIGKSQFIKSLIEYCTDYADYWGKPEGNVHLKHIVPLVIVTDSLTRLDTYNNEYCAFISSDNEDKPIKQFIKSQRKPFVLLTTQRFAKLEQNQIDLLFTFKPERNIKIKRKYLIIDEKPIIYNNNIINIEALNDLDTAISDISLINTPKSKTEKIWVQEQFMNAKKKKIDFMIVDEKTQNSNASYYYYFDHKLDSLQPNDLTADDERFIKYFDKNEIKIEMTNRKAYSLNTLNCLIQLQYEGCLYQSKRKTNTQEYQRQFNVIKNNLWLLLNPDYKTIIFDATADIDTTYILKENYHYIPTITRRSDDNLNLHYIPIPANKARISNANNTDYLKCICKYLKKEFPTNEKILLITYMQTAEIIESKKLLPENFTLAYFGNLKGSNDYREYTKIIHLGFNRFSDYDYFANICMNGTVDLTDFQQCTQDQSQKQIKEYMQQYNGNYEYYPMQEVFVNSVLTDFEQNIYRSAIRDMHNKKRVDVYMIWGDNYQDTINQAIADRYKDNIDNWEKPSFVDEYKTKARQTKDKKQTIPQKILQWLSKQPEGKEFRTADILQDLQLTDKQFQKAKKNSAVKSRLSDYQTEKKGYYKKLP